MATHLHAALEQLGAFAQTEHPLISVYADWGQIDNGSRPAIRQIEQELGRIEGELNLHGDARQHFLDDQQRIMDYLNTQTPAEASGLAIFACAAANAWMALPIYTPIETQVAVDRFPYAFQLAKIDDHYETFALVIAEGQEAQIFVIADNQPELAGETEASEKIKRFEAGGQAQMLFQRRTDNVIRAHIKDLGQELGKVIDSHGVQHVILSSNDAIKGIINEALPHQIQEKVVDYINLDPHADMATIMEVITPIIERVEQAREQGVVTDLENQVGSNARGMVGIADTAMALSKGQVRSLVLHTSFNGQGKMNLSNGFVYTGGETSDPYDGSDLIDVDLREAFVYRALGQGATIEVIDDSEYLAQHNGVGTLLHYRDDQQAKEVGSR